MSAADQERFWTVAEIGERWRVSEDSVRRLFSEVPGTLVLPAARKSENRTTRGYRTMRVPNCVLLAVEREYSIQ